METDPIAVVRAFIGAWNRQQRQNMLDLLAEDVFYHNVPMAPIRGLPAVTAYLDSAGPFADVNWQLVNIAACGPVVLTERIDAFTKDGRQIALPLMGAFEIRNGKIAAWRDYFDLAMYRRQLAGEA